MLAGWLTAVSIGESRDHETEDAAGTARRHLRTEYVYAMRFRDGKIAHMTEVWNDGYALEELGWT